MESRVDKAARLFKEGYNCAQAVFAAFSDLYCLDEDVALRLSCSFGAGIGRMREVCGAVSGMAMIAGLENGIVDGKDVKGKKDNYDLVNKVVNEFKKNNGSIICRELLGLKKNDSAVTDTMPAVRNDEYYKKRPCLQKVIECATIVEEMIISNSKKINRKVDFVQVTNPDHVTKVVDLADEIWREYYKKDLSEEQIEYMIERYQSNNVVTKKMINEGYDFYLLNDGSNVIGFTSFLREDDRLFVNNVFIKEEYRKKDYFELTMKKIIKEVNLRKVNKVLIQIDNYNKKGVEYLLEMGFEKIDDIKKDIGSGYVIHNCLLEKDIVV